MLHVATVVPDESDLLCEGCGYTLKGLPESGNCPECGKPIEQSIGEHRHPSAFEISGSVPSFMQTTAAVLFRPTQFYRTLTTRSNPHRARTFALLHKILASLLFATAAVGHLIWMFQTGAADMNAATMFGVWLLLTVVTMAFLTALTALAAWLSAIEAKYWGMRLPYHVVMRGLTFHAAHYLPVGLVAAGAVWGYLLLLDQRIIDHTADTIYLYTLCGLVIVSAVYLFQTYWIAMRSMMYANR